MRRSRRSSISDGRAALPPLSTALERIAGRATRAEHGGPSVAVDGPVLLLTAGKGGTGKTTVAGALAVELAGRGLRVVAASIDPAHNLGDVLDARLGPDPSPVPGVPGLVALEVDTERALEQYLDKLASQVQHAYRYLQVLNLDRYLESLRYSPGVEEHAVLEEMGRLLQVARDRQADVLIVDTPPTGLTVRVLALPGISVQWAEHLRSVRRALLERRGALERVVGPQQARVGDQALSLATDEAHDSISRILQEYHAAMESLRERLSDPRTCGLVVVKNPDRLSTAETDRALHDLAVFGVPVAMLVVNKAVPDAGGTFVDDCVTGWPYPRRFVPVFHPEPIGTEALRQVARFLGAALGPAEVRVP